MNPTHAELLVQRGRLLERISQQRIQLAQQVAPWVAVGGSVEGWLTKLRGGMVNLKQHPQPALLVSALLVLLGPKRSLRHARRALVLWRSWKWVQAWLVPD